jgi:hypothetical protein
VRNTILVRGTNHDYKVGKKFRASRTNHEYNYIENIVLGCGTNQDYMGIKD